MKIRLLASLCVLALFSIIPAQTLTLLPTGSSETLHRASFLNSRFGYVVGGSAVLKTTNGGTSWTAQNSGTSSAVTFVQFVDTSTGWMTASSTILKTTNGGANWNLQTSGTTQNLTRGFFINSSLGYVVGYGGTILKTTNGGTNWVTQNSGVTSDFLNAYFTSADTGYVVGSGGRIVKTTNGGATWVSQTSGVTAIVWATYFNNSSTGYATTFSGGILKTTNGGSNWTAQTTGNTKPLRGIYFISPTTGYAVGGSGSSNVVLKTTNGGTNWVSQSLPTTWNFNGIYFPDSTTGYAAGDNGTVLKFAFQTYFASDLVYPTNPAVYFAGTAISPNIPTVTTQSITSYTISPTLPAGLTFNTNTGAISGTPATSSPATIYTVNAFNGSSYTLTTLNITVLAPPSGLTYSSNPATYGIGAAITPNNPTVSGTTPITYSVTPTLPAGLNLNTGTGIIVGTPTVISPSANYTVTATNSVGSTTLSLNISVMPAPTLSYSANPAQYIVGTAITPNTPTVTGTATSYSVTPALSSGLVLNTTTGVISGTPSTPVSNGSYVITVNTTGGSATATLIITARLAPSNLSYSSPTALYIVGTAITSNTPTITGSATITYSVNPVLPAGLVLNASTGIISGTPTTPSAAANYVITASNPAGNTTATLTLAVTNPVGILQQSDIRSFTLKIHGSSSMVFSLPNGHASNYKLEILDMKGTSVWESRVEVGNQQNVLAWNGLASNGLRPASGLYLVRMTGVDLNKKQAIVRTQRMVYSP